MSKHLEELKAEVNSLCQKIIDQPAEQGIGKLLVATGSLYQKLLIVKHVQEHDLIAKEELEAYKEKMKSLLEESREKPVKHEEVELPQIKEEQGPIVAEQTLEKELDPVPSSNGEDSIRTASSVTAKLAKNKMSIGLNDRLAFVKVLFKGDSESYKAFIEKLNSSSLNEGLQYFQEELNKRSWSEEEEVYQRLLATFERAKS